MLQGQTQGCCGAHLPRLGNEGPAARVNELIRSLDSSYYLEKDREVFETLVSKTCYQLGMFQSPAEHRRFPCSW